MSGENNLKLIDIQAASQLLGLKVSRIRMAVWRNEIPFIRIGRLVRFHPAQLRAWLESNMMNKISLPCLPEDDI